MERATGVSKANHVLSPMGNVTNIRSIRVIGSIKGGKRAIKMELAGKVLDFEIEPLGPGVWAATNLMTGEVIIKGGLPK